MNSTDKNPSAIDRLPENPLTVIEARRSVFDFAEIWQYRDLLYILTVRDIKVRYKQTALGILWAIIQPLIMMAIFSFFFGRLAGIEADGLPYPAFVLAGLIPWTFFANAVNASGNSLVGNSSMLTKVYFPRVIIPMAAVGACLVDFAVAFVLLALFLFYFGIGFSANLLLLPVLVLLTTLLAFGVGLWAATINVKYRDVRHALPFLMQVWMFITPIIYPLSLLSENQRLLLAVNPMTGLVSGFRLAIFGTAVDLMSFGISIVLILSILLCSAYYFRRIERDFADVI